MAFRLREASSSLWPPDRKQMPDRQKGNDKETWISLSFLKLVFLSGKAGLTTLTRHSGGHGAPQSGHCGHGNLLRGELLSAGVSSSHHVGLQQSTLQVHMMVRQSLVHCCKNLKMNRQISYYTRFSPSFDGGNVLLLMMNQPFLWRTGNAASHGLRQEGSLAPQ